MIVEDSPEFQKALNEACEKQYRGWLFGGEYAQADSKDSIAETMEEIQRQRKEFGDGVRSYAETIRRQAMITAHPHMREITSNLKRKQGAKGLVCPLCGEEDHGNRINGKPYCFMNAKHKAKGVNGPVPLTTAEKAKEWKPPKKMPTLQELIEESLGTPKDRVVFKRREKKRRK